MKTILTHLCRGGAPGRKFLLGAGTLRRRDARPAQRRRHQPGSRAAANYAADDYFGLRGMAGASVSVKARTTTYIYADGTLAGATPDDVLYFPVDGSALASVKVYWPEEAVRQAQGGAIAKDQREKEAFLAADWLSAELKEVAPAQAVA